MVKLKQFEIAQQSQKALFQNRYDKRNQENSGTYRICGSMKIGSVQCVSALDWQKLPSLSQGFKKTPSSPKSRQTLEVKTNEPQIQILVLNIVFQVTVCGSTKSLAVEIH